MIWTPAYVGIGSNLQDPARQVLAAVAALGRLPSARLIVASSLYGSRPFGPVAQPDYCNAAVALLTTLPALDFFAQLRALEQQMGRERRERWGPRIIDLDLLCFGALRVSGPELTLPHPGIVQRNFVLYPLAEIAPQLMLPGLGRVAQLRDAVSPEGIWPLAPQSEVA